jgi:hypothetical protein
MTRVYLPSPTVIQEVKTAAGAGRLQTLEGRTIAVLRNGRVIMPGFARLLDVELRLAGASEVLHFRGAHSIPTSPELLDEIGSKVSGAITGLGN